MHPDFTYRFYMSFTHWCRKYFAT